MTRCRESARSLGDDEAGRWLDRTDSGSETGATLEYSLTSLRRSVDCMDIMNSFGHNPSRIAPCVIQVARLWAKEYAGQSLPRKADSTQLEGAG